MAKLIARPATQGLLPLEIGTCLLEDAQPGAITAIAPFDGKEAMVAKALGAFPAPGEMREIAAGRILWAGPGQALVLGEPVAADFAAISDQSDGWTVVTLSGQAARDVLARLTPLDLRDSTLPPGRTAKTLLGHMAVSLTRVGEYSYEIIAFRSMTASLIDELARAMANVAARAKL